MMDIGKCNVCGQERKFREGKTIVSPIRSKHPQYYHLCRDCALDYDVRELYRAVRVGEFDMQEKISDWKEFLKNHRMSVSNKEKADATRS